MKYLDYLHWREKHATGKTEKVSMRIINSLSEQTVLMDMPVHTATLAEIVELLIEHHRTPKWLRGTDWKVTNERLSNTLKDISVRL